MSPVGLIRLVLPRAEFRHEGIRAEFNLGGVDATMRGQAGRRGGRAGNKSEERTRQPTRMAGGILILGTKRPRPGAQESGRQEPAAILELRRYVKDSASHHTTCWQLKLNDKATQRSA